MIFFDQKAMNLWTLQNCELLKYYEAISACDFDSGSKCTQELHIVLNNFCNDLKAADPDEVYNDAFLFSMAIDTIKEYSEFWDLIFQSNFIDSWGKLQDIQDRLRLIFKFSKLTNIKLFKLFEYQCEHLEYIYPYKLFMSSELVYNSATCSICGLDIDSLDCPHLAGMLYRGKLAHAVVKISAVHGVSIVEHPADKRCVIQFPNDAQHFPLVNSLRTLLKTNMNPWEFAGVKCTQLPVPPVQLKNVGRNELCPCDSGIKFKNCCLIKNKFFHPHYEILVSSDALLSKEDIIFLKQSDIDK